MAFDGIAPDPPPPGAVPDLPPPGAVPVQAASRDVVPDPPPPGAVPDPPPGGSIEGPMGEQSVSAAPVSLGERFATNFHEGVHGSMVGALADLAATKLAPDRALTDPNTGQPMPSLKSGMLPMLQEEKAQGEMFPSWTDEPGIVNKALHGGAALAGALAGGIASMSPENVLVPGHGVKLGYAAGREAAPFLSRQMAGIAGKDAAVQGGAMTAANVADQVMQTFTGTRDAFDPVEVATQGAMGLGMGGLAPVVGFGLGRMVSRLRGGPRVAAAPEPPPIPPQDLTTDVDGTANMPPPVEPPPVPPDEPPPIPPVEPPPVPPSAPGEPPPLPPTSPPGEPPPVPAPPGAVPEAEAMRARLAAPEPPPVPLSPEAEAMRARLAAPEPPPANATPVPPVPLPDPAPGPVAPPEPPVRPHLPPVALADPRATLPAPTPPRPGEAAAAAPALPARTEPTAAAHTGTTEPHPKEGTSGPPVATTPEPPPPGATPIEGPRVDRPSVTGPGGPESVPVVGPGDTQTIHTGPPAEQSPGGGGHPPDSPGNDRPGAATGPEPPGSAEDLNRQRSAIADDWDKLGDPKMANIVRQGAKLGTTEENLTFLRKQLAEARSRADPDAPKPKETFDLDKFMSEGSPRQKQFGAAASEEAKAVGARVQTAAQGITDEINGLGLTQANAHEKGGRGAELKQELSSLLGNYSRYANTEVSRVKGHKNFKPAEHAAALAEVEKALAAREGERQSPGATRQLPGDPPPAGAVPTEPRPGTGPGTSDVHAAIAELDGRKAPDADYRALLSTGSKEPLKPGETWRGRAEKLAASLTEKPAESPPAESRPGGGEKIAPTEARTGNATETEPKPTESVSRSETPKPKPAEVKTASGKRPVSDYEANELTNATGKARRDLSAALRKRDTPPAKLAELDAAVRAAEKAQHEAEGPPPKPTNSLGGKILNPDAAKGHAASVAEHEALVNRRVHAEGQDPTPDIKGPARLLGGKDASVVRAKDSKGREWVGNGTVMVRTDKAPAAERAATAAVKRATTKLRADLPPAAMDNVTNAAGHDNPITWDRHVTEPGGTEIVIGTTHAGDTIVLHKNAWDTMMHAAGDGGRLSTDASKPTKGNTLASKVIARDANGDVVGVAMPRRVSANEAHTFTTGEVRATPEAPAKAPSAKRQGLRDQVFKREAAIDKMEALGASESKIAAAREQANRLRESADMPVQGQLTDRVPRSIPRAPLTPADRAHYSPGASAYRDVFRDAGHDPERAVQYPIKRQAEIVRQQVQDHFGFKNVTSDQTSIDTRNMLSDFYHNAQSMAAALGMPYRAISLDGRLSLDLGTVNRQGTMGSYQPGNRTISLMGRSNSFAHEWTHGWDHHLADQLRRNPRAMALLSETQALRQARFAPGSTAEGFANVIGAIYGNRASDALELLRLQHLATSRDPRVALQASRELTKMESDFAKGVRALGAKFGPGATEYWYRPAEMLARAHEAYVEAKIRAENGDSRAVTKPGHAYEATGPDAISETFEKLYPKAEDRDRIFAAFEGLHDAQRAESIAAFAGPAGALPSNADMLAPHLWGAMADVKEAGAARVGVLRREINAWRKPLNTIKQRLGMDTSRPAANVGPLTRAADVGRALTYTPRALMEVMVHRVPEGPARDAFQKIMDHFAGAEGIRDAKVAAGRHIGEVYEEDFMHNERRNISRFTDALRLHDLENMTDAQAVQMHRAMTGDTTGVPQNILDASAKVRGLLDAEHARHQIEADIDLGYAPNAYFPRVLDPHQVFNDPKGFARDAYKVYEHVYDRDVVTRADMLTAHTDLGDAGRAHIPANIEAKIKQIRENEAQARALASERARLDPNDPAEAKRIAAIDAEATRLERESDALHNEVEPHVQHAFALKAADDWANRIVVGSPTDYDTRGPEGRYTKKRFLPPEADALLRKWYVTDPRSAIPTYFRQSARRIAFAKRFGKDGSGLDALMQQAADGGARGEDIRSMRGYVEALTGRPKSDLSSIVTNGIDKVTAIGTMALMTRAAFTSLSEPMNAILRTGKVSAALGAYANQIGDIARTASSKERKALAEAIGLTTSSLYDSTHAHRMNATYDDFPAMNKLLMTYFRRTGLTALTNSQRRAMMQQGHIILGAWARDLTGTNARLKREAAAQFRDLGIADKDHAALARFLETQGKSLPDMHGIETDAGHLWGQAVRRLVNTTIQEPLKVDKPLMSSNSLGRMMFGLMGYNYAFYHHVIERPFQRFAARVGEAEGVTGKAAETARATMTVLPAAAGMYGAAMASTVVREALFNSDKWKEMDDQGELMSWLSDLAIQRTGINGPLDPLIQAVNGLRYEKSITGLLAGAQVGFLAHAMEKVLGGFVRASPHTNTAAHGALQGAYEGVLMPAMLMALTALPGGPLTSAAASAAMMKLSSKSASTGFADALAGPKGSTEATPGKLPKLGQMQQLPKLGAKTGAEGGGGSVPWGLVDDVLAPGVRVAQKLPGPLKLAGVGAASLFGLGSVANELGRFTEPPREKARP